MHASLHRLCIFALVAVVFSLAIAEAYAQAPLVLEKRRGIKFGKVAADLSTPGTVVLSPTADSITISGPLVNFGGTVRRGRIKITGEPRAEVIVTLPSSPITIRRGTSGNVMIVENFTMDRTNPVKLNRNGTRTINIGATLRVDANQRRGTYNDDNLFTVDVEYF